MDTLQNLHTARQLLSEGKRIEGCQILLKILSNEPDNFNAAALVAHARFAGIDYHDILRHIHDEVNPKTYLEIGVDRGKTLSLAREGCLAIGVDPRPTITHKFLAETRIYKQTSDEFFQIQNIHEIFGGSALNLVFIDGLHLFGQALRDFMNVEAVAHPGTVVLMHDCYPLNKYTSSIERRSQFWSGDVWKCMPVLARYRPDLDVRIIETAPTGLALIQGLDPSSRLLHENWDSIVEEWAEAIYDEQKLRRLPLLPAHWPDIEIYLRQGAAAPR